MANGMNTINLVEENGEPLTIRVTDIDFVEQYETIRSKSIIYMMDGSVHMVKESKASVEYMIEKVMG
jgi:hypothetical protein